MSKNADKKETNRSIAVNRRAGLRYEFIETLEAGLALTGSEVKSVRAANVNLSDGFVRIENEQAYLWNVHIAPYTFGSSFVPQDPTRRRRLLLNRTEIKRWMGKTTVRGLTIVPLEIYFNKRGLAKLKIALAKHKTGPDRRDDIKKRDLGREMQREYTGKRRVR